MTRNIKKITILLVFISLFYLTTPAAPTPWFREKYLKETYDQYYVYAYETEYKDRNHCPEIHKPAILTTITGITPQYKHVRPLPRVLQIASVPISIPPYQPPKSHYSYILDTTIRDILLYISKILPYISNSPYYIWQTFIVLLYLALTIPLTVMVLVLFFGQY